LKFSKNPEAFSDVKTRFYEGKTRHNKIGNQGLNTLFRRPAQKQGRRKNVKKEREKHT